MPVWFLFFSFFLFLSFSNDAPKTSPEVSQASQHFMTKNANHLLNPQVSLEREFWVEHGKIVEELFLGKNTDPHFASLIFLSLFCSFVTLAIHFAVIAKLLSFLKTKLSPRSYQS